MPEGKGYMPTGVDVTTITSINRSGAKSKNYPTHTDGSGGHEMSHNLTRQGGPGMKKNEGRMQGSHNRGY